MKNSAILKYEVNPREYDYYPVHWEKIFKRAAPLAVEVGCGNGEYLVSWARSRPEWNFLGIELSLASGERIQSRIFSQQLDNIRFLRDDARFVLPELFPDQSIGQVVMNFPDPWPKEKHRERRLITPSFIDSLGGVLVLDGSFELYTDQEGYALKAQELFNSSSLFTAGEVEINPQREVSTKYERKWREQYRHIYRFQAKKSRNTKIRRLLENTTMPHVYLPREVSLTEIKLLKGLTRIQDDQVCKIKEVFSSPENQAYLLRTVTSDRDYVQNFFILVARQEQGYIVKIDSGYQPYRTPAVKMAVQEVGRLLHAPT
jgi:tRNA (guanine-N7-)-methyltransferase